MASGLIGRFRTIDPTDGGCTGRYQPVGEWQRSAASTVTKVATYVMRSDST